MQKLLELYAQISKKLLFDKRTTGNDDGDYVCLSWSNSL